MDDRKFVKLRAFALFHVKLIVPTSEFDSGELSICNDCDNLSDQSQRATTVASESEDQNPHGKVTQSRVDEPHHDVLARSHVPVAGHSRRTFAAANAAGVDLEATAMPVPSPSRGVLLETSFETSAAVHASELAEKLQQQADELDRRSALLASQEAEIETKLRGARVWFDAQRHQLDERAAKLGVIECGGTSPATESDERQVELEQRQRDLDKRQAEIHRQLEQVASDRARLAAQQNELAKTDSQLRQRETAFDERRQAFETQRNNLAGDQSQLEVTRREIATLQDEFDDREAEIAAREQQLAFRHREITASLARFEKLGVVEQRLAEANEQAAIFAARSRHLDEAESLLTEQTQQVAEIRKQLERERNALQERLVSERRELATQRQQWLSEKRQREAKLSDRERALDTREKSLGQLRSELENTQREVLEMRLATEETWSQLAGALSPATLARSLSQTRAKLVDHYQISLTEIEQKQHELKQLQNELASEHKELSRGREQLREWAVRREEDLQSQAIRLVGREQELNRQQQQYEQLEISWSRERDELKAQVRSLLAELRTTTLREAA